MKKLLHKLLWSDDGPTTVEYAVLLALLMGAFFGSVQLIGQETKNSVNKSSDTIHESFTQAGVGSF
jgi:Flp pilus assembly pilin Flp